MVVADCKLLLASSVVFLRIEKEARNIKNRKAGRIVMKER